MSCKIGCSCPECNCSECPNDSEYNACHVFWEKVFANVRIIAIFGIFLFGYFLIIGG
jgi:hypothetical protein